MSLVWGEAEISGECHVVFFSSGNVVSHCDIGFWGEVHSFFSRAPKIIKKLFCLAFVLK
jgi:hypothetical protein